VRLFFAAWRLSRSRRDNRCDFHNQINGDSGAGARVGNFESRVAGIGRLPGALIGYHKLHSGIRAGKITGSAQHYAGLRHFEQRNSARTSPIGIDLIDENGPVLSTVALQIFLAIALDIQPRHLTATVHRALRHGGANGSPFPPDIARQTDVH
jgi:hypothetical protein